MRVKYIAASFVAFALGPSALTLQANDNEAGHVWMPKQPGNHYWQAPNWSGFSQTPPPSYYPAQPAYTPPPAYNNRYRPPVAPAYRPPYPANNYPAPGVNRGYPPVQNTNRGYPPPPPGGPYRGSPYGPDSGASAYNTPGYNRYRSNRGNNNKFWGRSGPNTWMNPNKRNMERGWDDMINAPGRMGTMPGGWTAPEVTMPNPIDMGDQMQDNVQDLPEQMRDMNVGNDVK